MNHNEPSAAFPLFTAAQREALLLVPYAMHSAATRGRKYPETDHPYRGPYQRDRDRILHSAAYRRLSGKMQVFTGDMGDYHRTRLTHTQEVASIARTIGRVLRLNEDLVEALALLHDIGHPPFGHAGEDALAECLAGDGGFSHNRQALTIVEELEHRYQQFPGLNLTYEVLAGQITRAGKGPARGGSDLSPATGGLLEVQVVEAADSITYDAHDTDDAVKLGLVSLEELAEIPMIREATRRVRERYGPKDGNLLRKGIVHELIDWQVSDVLETFSLRSTAKPANPSPNAQPDPLWVGVSPRLATLKGELEQFLYDRVYRHARLVEVRHAAQDRLRSMFEGYLGKLDLLPPKFRARAEQVGPRRSVADYLAGMTDRFCDEQFRLHFASDRGG